MSKNGKGFWNMLSLIFLKIWYYKLVLLSLFFLIIRSLVDSKYMKKDHQQMQFGSFAIFLDGQVAKPGFSANSCPVEHCLDPLTELIFPFSHP